MVTETSEREFMERAVEEMHKSRSEHEDKTDPLVGAILVKDGEVKAARHRGKYREGDHAEYTILERDCPNEDLEGATLYVTLEPCTVRSPQKTPCAERIKQARLGRVVIGLPDPNPKIQGKGIQYLLDHDIDVDFFEHDLMKEIRRANKGFIESMEEQTDIDDELERDEISDYEETVVDRASINSLDEDLIERYLEEKNETYKVPSDDLWAYLEERNFLVKQDGEYRPTFAGLLLFGKAPGDIFPHSRVTVLGRFGKERETKDFNGGIIGLPDALNPMFQKYVRHYDTEGGWKRGKKAEFPEKAFREAVINAVAHRDYTIEGMRAIVEISPDEIVVKSPGLPLKPNDFQKIRSFNATPYSRNPRIASVLNTMGYMEERGEGLNDIKDLLEEHGLEEPNFDHDGPYFVVEMKKPTRAVPTMTIDKDILRKLNDRQKKMLRFIQENGMATSKDFEDEFDVDLQTIRRNLNKMVDEIGILNRDDKRKPKEYTLNEEAQGLDLEIT